eukprot:48047-Eustigmatos_ZCMA.PRE.1
MDACLVLTLHRLQAGGSHALCRSNLCVCVSLCVCTEFVWQSSYTQPVSFAANLSLRRPLGVAAGDRRCDRAHHLRGS